MMASYSRVFKAAQVSVMPEVRVLSSTPIIRGKPEEAEDQAIVAVSTAQEETDTRVQQLLEEAKKQASEMSSECRAKSPCFRNGNI